MLSFRKEMNPEIRRILGKLPLGDHGLPIPDIRILNEITADVFERDISGRGSLVLLGHLEDYLLDNRDGDCRNCGSELVRVAIQPEDLTDYFQSGLIICPNSYIEGERHPFEFWLEVWPNAFLLDEDRPKGKRSYQQFMEEYLDFTFRYSNPTVRRCHDSINLVHHFLSALEKEIPDDELTFPEPDYVLDYN